MTSTRAPLLALLRAQVADHPDAQDAGTLAAARAEASRLFLSRPDARSYVVLAALSADEPGWREGGRDVALDLLRPAGPVRPVGAVAVGGAAPGDALVEALLLEGDHERAWEEGTRHGCGAALRLRSAWGVVGARPHEALPVLARRVEQQAEGGTRWDYACACSTLVRIRDSLRAAGADDVAVLGPVVEHLAARYPRRRTLVAMLGNVLAQRSA